MSRIAFWAAGHDGSSWYRCDLPAEALGWAGHEVLVSEVLTPHQIERQDVIIGSRIANESSARMWLQIARVRTEGTPRLILDLDDAYFALTDDNPASDAWDEPALQRLAACIRAADCITVASRRLGDHVREYVPDSPDIFVIPNGLHAGWLSTPRDYNPEVLTVGWAGTASSAVDFDLITRALALAVAEPNVQARLVGIPDDAPGLVSLARHVNHRDRDKVQGVAWVPHGQPYLAAVGAFDIWLAPYRSNDFVDAKFPTKALEAGMLGIPLVASMVPPYEDWITHGVDGLLVPPMRPWEWTRHVKSLLESPAYRQQIGETSRSRAATHIMQSLGQVWETVALRFPAVGIIETEQS